MSSRRGGAGASDQYKGNTAGQKSTPGVEQLIQGVAAVNLEAGQGDGWETYTKKTRARTGSAGWKQLVSKNSNPNAWGNPDTSLRLGIRSNAGSGKSPTNACSTLPTDGHGEDEDSDEMDDSDDGFLSDDFDSDESEKSFETRKKNRWFKELFECLDSLTVEQVSDPERQWHCPACKGGPGAIDWYRGLQPLITHAKTKGSKRVRLHRELAELLDEELRQKGTSLIPAGEIFGKWKAIDGGEREIVWPPMVIIMNTRLDKDDKEKWIGMGNQELLDYFSSYDYVVKARHSYGPQGHRGTSLLIFEKSAVGYQEAERLSKDFENNGRGRAAWDNCRIPFYPGGARQLYGYIAEKRDIDSFNQHCQGKTKLKFEMRSYQEMVVSQLKQMNENNHKVIYLENKVNKGQKQLKAAEESLGIVSGMLRKREEESRVVRERTKQLHEQNREEMDSQEQFFKDQLSAMRESRKAKEEEFEKVKQEEMEKVKKDQYRSSRGDNRRSADEAEKVILKCQDREEEFVAEKERLVKSNEEKMLKILERKRQLFEEEVALEQELDGELAKLMSKYAPAGAT